MVGLKASSSAHLHRLYWPTSSTRAGAPLLSVRRFFASSRSKWNEGYPPPPETGQRGHYAVEDFPCHSSKSYFHFEILHKSTKSAARVGRIHTPHGTTSCPSFTKISAELGELH